MVFATFWWPGSRGKQFSSSRASAQILLIQRFTSVWNSTPALSASIRDLPWKGTVQKWNRVLTIYSVRKRVSRQPRMTLEECNHCSKRGDLKTCSRWHLSATWTETNLLISQFPQSICCPSVWPRLHQGTFRCGMAAFCGPECQKKGWTEHRVDCRLHNSVLGHDNCKCQFNHCKTKLCENRYLRCKWLMTWPFLEPCFTVIDKCKMYIKTRLCVDLDNSQDKTCEVVDPRK